MSEKVNFKKGESVERKKSMTKKSCAVYFSSIAVLISGCGPSAEEIRLNAEKEAKEKEIAQIEKFKEAVSDQFSDPASTQFRKLTLLKDGKGLCGEYNAKNRMGGYVGFRAFGVDAGGTVLTLREMNLRLAKEDEDVTKKMVSELIMAGARSNAQDLIMDRLQRNNFKYWNECAG